MNCVKALNTMQHETFQEVELTPLLVMDTRTAISKRFVLLRASIPAEVFYTAVV